MAKRTKQKVERRSAASEVGVASKSKVKENRQDIVRKELLDVHKVIEENYIDMAKLLNEAYHKEFYTEWGFDNFQQYCEKELDFEYRKAMYLIEIWDKVKSLNLPEARVAKLGWTKMKDLAQVITKKNFKKWFDKAEKMTTRDLTEAVKITRKKDVGSDTIPSITTMTLKMGEAEANVITDAIEEAKKLVESDNTVAALELICQDWLMDKGAQPSRTSLEDMIKYMEDAYGVKLTVGKKSTSSKKADSGKGKKQAKKKAKGNGKGVPEETPILDTDANEGDFGGDEQDIDDILGIDG